MTWVKGQSGNPSGRKKGKGIADILKKIGKEKVPDDLKETIARYWPDRKNCTIQEAILRCVCADAIKGDSWSRQFIAERTEGKTPLVMDINETKRLEIVEEIVPARVEGRTIEVLPESCVESDGAESA